MDEAEVRRWLEDGCRQADIALWEERSPSMALPDDEYLALRKAKWLQHPANHRKTHPFEPARILARRERKRTKTLTKIDQNVRKEATELLQILIENRELTGATGPPTSVDHLVVQSTYWARHWVREFQRDYQEMLDAGSSPDSLDFMAQTLRDFEADLAGVEVLRRDPTRDRHNWAVDRQIARHRARLEVTQLRLPLEVEER